MLDEKLSKNRETNHPRQFRCGGFSYKNKSTTKLKTRLEILEEKPSWRERHFCGENETIAERKKLIIVETTKLLPKEFKESKKLLWREREKLFWREFQKKLLWREFKKKRNTKRRGEMERNKLLWIDF